RRGAARPPRGARVVLAPRRRAAAVDDAGRDARGEGRRRGGGDRGTGGEPVGGHAGAVYGDQRPRGVARRAGTAGEERGSGEMTRKKPQATGDRRPATGDREDSGAGSGSGISSVAGLASPVAGRRLFFGPQP